MAWYKWYPDCFTFPPFWPLHSRSQQGNRVGLTLPYPRSAGSGTNQRMDEAGSDDITISNQADAERYSDCRDIRGTLRIDAAASGTIHLDNVEAIRGDFAVQGTQSLDSLDLPRLETVRGDVTAKDNANLNQLGMAGLRRLGGDLTIVDNSALLDLSLAALESVGGGLHLKGGFNTYVRFPC
ncbi:hypothetical protein P175DRAFT_0470651 [Aspergillus ochraceoroseus IBT 24754]|uniref:Receptor L-domain domain-containing protein n=1 Tax=Aspergillus ochraceoroseus IBT 24754 TaxID=1392256 RepID=A0A2T5M7I3_9EURO|nr:uncharacterized protein P175DRAFT_0470651 [Aspergillus ochraceoroseus IBT 24754]PTU24499.1 hypothetical protein P175DRAFT_0470651 [Aspergillus ochraceoroseus IBT 24754]